MCNYLGYTNGEQIMKTLQKVKNRLKQKKKKKAVLAGEKSPAFACCWRQMFFGRMDFGFHQIAL